MHRHIMLLTLFISLCFYLIPGFAISSGAFNNDILEDSHLDLTLKNVWMLNTTDQLADIGAGEQRAWAQALHVDWQSGWYRNTFGVDASWYGVAKLYANKAFYGRDLLRDNHGHAEGFNKIGQLYGKAKWGEENRYLYVWAGWKQLYKFGVLNVTRSRAAPSTWEGISAEMGWDTVNARAAVVNRFSERDEPEKRHFYTLKSNKRIDYITTGEVSWLPEKGTKVAFITGESKAYLLRHALEAQATFSVTDDFSLITRGLYYYNRGLSEWEGARGFTHEARHFYAQIGYQYGASQSGIGWSKTKAHLDNGLGYFYWHFGKNTRGAFNSPADGEGNDYINDGEKMIYLYSQYNLFPEWIIGIYGNYGYGIKYENVALKEWEYGTYFSWTPESLKTLNIFAGFGPSYSWKLTAQKKPYLTENKQSFHRAKGVGGAIRIEYRFNLF